MRRLGRNRPLSLGPHFRLAHYLRASMPAPPDSQQYFVDTADPVTKNVLRNNALGCCVIAAGYHLVGIETANAGALWTPSDADIEADYSSIGGWNPADPSTDQGCDEVVALNYWQAHGFRDGTKLAAWVTVDATNDLEVRTALWLFGGLLLTLELPTSYTENEPEADGYTWDLDVPNPAQGHAIMAGSYSQNSDLGIDTWGLLGRFTSRARRALCVPSAGGGLYAVLSPDQIVKGAGKAPNGFAWRDLVSDIDTLGASIPLGPTPPPLPPAPPAPPGSPVTLNLAQQWLSDALSAQPNALLTRATAIALGRDGLARRWPTS